MTTAQRLEIWVWVLIYLGLGVVGLGLSVQRNAAALGWSIVAFGSVAVVIGIVLIWLRARITH